MCLTHLVFASMKPGGGLPERPEFLQWLWNTGFFVYLGVGFACGGLLWLACSVAVVLSLRGRRVEGTPIEPEPLEPEPFRTTSTTWVQDPDGQHRRITRTEVWANPEAHVKTLDCGCPAPEPPPMISIWEHLDEDLD